MSGPEVEVPKLPQADGVDVYCAHDAIVPVDKVVGNPRNPNTHPAKQLQMLARIIAAQGWRAPITVSERSGFVVRGHGRLEAARILGKASVPVDYQAYGSEAAEWADLIADNRIAELAEIDAPTLREILEAVNASDLDLDLTGFTAADLDGMRNADGSLDVVEDTPPDPPAVAITKPGDVWTMGEHRLLCGNSTSIEDVDYLMAGRQADMIVLAKAAGTVARTVGCSPTVPASWLVRALVRTLGRLRTRVAYEGNCRPGGRDTG